MGNPFINPFDALRRQQPEFPVWELPQAAAPPPAPPVSPVPEDPLQKEIRDKLLRQLGAAAETPKFPQTDLYQQSLQQTAPIQPGLPGGPPIPWYKKIGAAALGAVGGAAAGLAAAKGNPSTITPKAIGDVQRKIELGDFPERQAQYQQDLARKAAAAKAEIEQAKASSDLQGAASGNIYRQGEAYKYLTEPSKVAAASTIMRNGTAVSKEDLAVFVRNGGRVEDLQGIPWTEARINQYGRDANFNYILQGGKVMAMPANRPEVITDINGNRAISGQFNRYKVGTGEIPPSGYTSTGDITTRQEIGFNPATQQLVPIDLRGTSTPVRMPSPGNRMQQLRQPPEQRDFPALPPSNAPTQPAPVNVPSPGGAAPGGFSAVPLKNLDAINKRVTPVREAANQIFGDPGQPELRPLITFAKLADDTEAQKRIKPALELALEKVKSSANAYRGGGLLEYMSDVSGFTQAKADARASVLANAVNHLSKEDMALYDAVMAMYGTAMGLRALTSGGVGVAYVNRIESELPILGINTTNSASFFDKLSKLGELVRTGARSVPAIMFNNPGEFDRYTNMPKFVEQQRQLYNKDKQARTVETPKGPITFSTPEKAAEFKRQLAVLSQQGGKP